MSGKFFPSLIFKISIKSVLKPLTKERQGNEVLHIWASFKIESISDYISYIVKGIATQFFFFLRNYSYNLVIL